MNLFEKKVENKILLWTLLGPSMIILSLLVSLMKFSPQSFYLPLGIIVALPACWIWKVRGTATSIPFLFILLLIAYSGIDSDARLWHLGITLSVVLGMIVSTLSFEELSDITNEQNKEKQAYLDHIIQLDTKLLQANDQIEIQKKANHTQVTSLYHAINKKEDLIASYEKAHKTVQKEMQQHQERREGLVSEILSLKKEITRLKEQKEQLLSKQQNLKKEERNQLAAQEMLLKETLDLQDDRAQKERKDKEQKEAFKALLYERDLLSKEITSNKKLLRVVHENMKERETFYRKEIDDRDYQLYMQNRRYEESQEKLSTQQQILQDYHALKESFKEKIDSLKGEAKNREKKLRDKLNSFRVENFQLQLDKKSEETKINSLKKEVGTLTARVETPKEEVQRLYHVEQLYKQLRKQFDEKSNVLHQTRGELFKKEGELLAVEKEKEIKSVEATKLEKMLEKQILSLDEEKEEVAQEVEYLTDLVSSLIKERKEEAKKEPLLETRSSFDSFDSISNQVRAKLDKARNLKK